MARSSSNTAPIASSVPRPRRSGRARSPPMSGTRRTQSSPGTRMRTAWAAGAFPRSARRNLATRTARRRFPWSLHRLSPCRRFPRADRPLDLDEGTDRGGEAPAEGPQLFGYTGVASLVAAAAGAEVTHVDASKKAIGWARENQSLSRLDKAPIRWICEDAMKFILREERRGNRYDIILTDPRNSAGVPMVKSGSCSTICRSCSTFAANFWRRRRWGWC